MEDNKNKKEQTLRNASSSTPAQLLASVLEQRYARKSSAVIRGKDEKPDPMTFPAVQKALGPMYSTIVEIVEEEEENEEAAAENNETASADTTENIKGLSEQLLSMVEEIENSDRQRENEKEEVIIEVKKKKEDPYNRSLNSHSASFDDIETIDLEEDVAIETIVSEIKKKNS